MDPLTQAALGATAGALVSGRQLGVARAAAWGAFAGALPDIDLLANIADDPFFNLRHHRGITHALWFGPVVGSMLGWLLWRKNRRREASIGLVPWVAVMVAGLMSHPLLDCFTHYGTQLLAPFSDHRFVLPAVPAVDPVYSLLLACGLCVALVRSRWASKSLGSGLVLSTLYLGLGLYSNFIVANQAQAALEEQGLTVDRLGVFPTMLQLPLRRVVAITGSDVRVSFVTARNDCPIEWGPVGQTPNAAQLGALTRSTQGETFAWFTNHWLAMGEGRNGELRFADLRFGFSRQPEQGLWLVELNAAGPPAYLRNRPAVDFDSIRQLFKIGFGTQCHPWSERNGPVS